MKRNIGLLMLVAGALNVPAHAEPLDVPVTVSSEDQARLGISSSRLEAQDVSLGVDAVVRSVDPLPLFALNSDIVAATAAAAASESELQRVAGLFRQDGSASQQALEAARARATADSAALSLLHRRLDVEWGPAFSAETDTVRQELIDEVIHGAAALLRADAPERPDGVVGRVFVELADGEEISTVELLGLAGMADQRMQTIGLYCVARGDAAKRLRPGRILGGRIETGSVLTGVVLPRSALVRIAGKTWAYLRTGEEKFLRREVVGGSPVAGGWYVAEGFEPGTEIVDKGAGSLIAIETVDEAAEED